METMIGSAVSSALATSKSSSRSRSASATSSSSTPAVTNCSDTAPIRRLTDGEPDAAAHRACGVNVRSAPTRFHRLLGM
jgi:hypothetical protein